MHVLVKHAFYKYPVRKQRVWGLIAKVFEKNDSMWGWQDKPLLWNPGGDQRRTGDNVTEGGEMGSPLNAR